MGLRERKKARTRADIQREAFRLFRQQGYSATTIDEICEAAEVSPTTFFRYFPSKEDVVLRDEFDEAFVQSFKSQPPELSSLEAFRRAYRSIFSGLTADQLAQLREFQALVFSVPELRARTIDELSRTMQMVADVVAERTGRPSDDTAVRAFSGAVIGVTMSVMLATAGDSGGNLLTTADAALAQLEVALRL